MPFCLIQTYVNVENAKGSRIYLWWQRGGMIHPAKIFGLLDPEGILDSTELFLFISRTSV